MKTFAELFNAILIGDQELSRLAAREVRKLLYGSHRSGDSYEIINNIITRAPEVYVNMTEDWRRENFVIAISVIYYLHDRESQPDFLFAWLYELIQHTNGNIRQAAVRMFENELGPLTVHLRYPDSKSSYLRKLSIERADQILFEMFTHLSDLSSRLLKPVYKRYKYISSLPSGPYKSVQMVLGHLIEDCGEEYVSQMEQSIFS